MKKLVFALATALAALAAQAQEWKLDASHSSVNFTITHMMVSEVHGNFRNFSAVATATKPDFSDLATTFTIDANTINTADEKRDEHLRSDDFFATSKYPNITFKSSSIKKIDDKKFVLEGEMTMHGVTKKISWDLKYNGTVNDGRGGKKAGFKATTTINRKDYGISFGRVLDNGGAMLSDEVEIVVSVELNQSGTK
ncbi:MAG: YceI family protein [Chitinophagales bacterium]